MNIKKNFESIKKDLPQHVTLVAASKKKSPEIIREAFDAGQKIFGESYVQELLEKYDSPLLKGHNIEWHFIGNLQRNKVKYIIDKVSLIQSVSSLRLAEEINKRAKMISKVQDILVEINIGDEETKGGVKSEEVKTLTDEVRVLSNLNLKGLMIIPPFSIPEEELISYYNETYSIYNEIGAPGILSMGMSDDWRLAIKYGSNMVRIGTALLGPR